MGQIIVEQAPSSLELEQAVLGAVLANPDAYVLVNAFLKGDDFFFIRHEYIWDAIGHVTQRGDYVDMLTVMNEVKAAGKLNDIGGATYLMELVNNTPSTTNVETYARMVQRLAVRRRMLAVADKIKQLAMDEKMPTETALAEADKQWLKLRGEGTVSRDKTLQEWIIEYMDEIERMYESGELVMGIPTGYRDLDDILNGLHKTDFTILAGRPGMGKSALLANVAMNAARLGAKVGFFSLEMGGQQIIRRLVSTETGLMMEKLRKADLTPEQYRQFVLGAGNMGKKMMMHLDDTPAITPQYIRGQIAKWRARTGIDLIFVDYLQKMTTGGVRDDNRVQEVGYVASELKNIAKEFEIPVISAAQLSRAVEQRQDKRPMLSDLRESGEIEQEADVIWFLYRDAYYNEATEFPSRADVIIAKHRNGATGTVSLHFEKTLTKFSDARVTTFDISQL